MDELPLWLLIVLLMAVAALAAVLVDVARSEVRLLPRWAWALVVVLVSFPLGALLYLVLGRGAAGPGGDGAGVGALADLPPPPAAGPPLPDLATVLATPASSPAAASATDHHGPPVVATHHLTKRYGEHVALTDVGLTVPRGSIYGLIGPNGAGKTTLLSILAGLRRATAGEVELTVPRQRVAVLVDTPLFEPWLTAREVVDLARHLVAPELPTDRVTTALREVGLADAADRRSGGFSRGMLQRLGLATCLVGDPELLVLDEPSSALDPAGRREVLDLIGRLGHDRTVVVSTHILGDVQQVCDVVGVIDRGRLVFQGPLPALLARTSGVVALHVRPPADQLVSALRDQPWLREVDEQAPGRLRLVVHDPAAAEAALPGLLHTCAVRLVSVHPATDLETAFLELTS